MDQVTTYTPAPIPADEEERLKALKALNILDTVPEERFDRITKLATVLFSIPISTVTLVDSRREWYKSCQGLPVREGERAISFCGYTVLGDEPLIIPDAKEDPRFAGNPMVISSPFIRFYAGVPLKSADGKRVGAFCIKDHNPREFPPEKVELLTSLAVWAELELNAHELSIALNARRHAEQANTELDESLKNLNQALRHDILGDLTIVRDSINSFNKDPQNKETLEKAIEAVGRSIALIEEMKELDSSYPLNNPLRGIN
jgi:GAF domain-containing protein